MWSENRDQTTLLWGSDTVEHIYVTINSIIPITETVRQQPTLGNYYKGLNIRTKSQDQEMVNIQFDRKKKSCIYCTRQEGLVLENWEGPMRHMKEHTNNTLMYGSKMWMGRNFMDMEERYNNVKCMYRC